MHLSGEFYFKNSEDCSFVTLLSNLLFLYSSASSLPSDDKRNKLKIDQIDKPNLIIQFPAVSSRTRLLSNVDKLRTKRREEEKLLIILHLCFPFTLNLKAPGGKENKVISRES